MVSPSDAQDKKNTSWLSKVFGKDRHTDKTNTRELADESTAQNTPALKIEALLESVNSASQQVRNFYITFLVVGFYIAMIIWSTTDVMLLKETPVKLPILDVELPITGFYWFAPFFYLLLHFNLLLQLGLLSDKIHRFDDAVASLDKADKREHYYSRLFSFAFTQALSGRQHFWFLKFLLTLMVWITIIWLPLGLLIGLQVGFLAYHDGDILFWQRFAIGLDLVFLGVFWPIIRSRDGNGLAWIMQIVRNIIPSLMTYFSPVRTWVSWWLPIPRETKQSNVYLAIEKYSQVKSSGKLFFESNVIIITLVSVVVFSWGVAVLPDSDHEKWTAKMVPEKWLTKGSLRDANNKDHRYFRLTEYLFDKTYQKKTDSTVQTQDSIFNRNLRIREQLLIANKLKAEEVADITSEVDEVREAALKKVEELVLSGRDFRYADFSEARLPKVDFVGANEDPSDLSYASLQSTMLSKARMNGTALLGTNLSKARLQDANLRRANLQGAYLIETELQDADLRGAKLQDADLRGAKLQNSNLSRAELQGANLSMTKLDDAVLSDAKLQDANLIGAELPNAVLIAVDLQNADLREAKLQGANLSQTKLQDADLRGVKLQDADLTKAKFQGAVLRWAELQGADLREAELQGADLSQTKLQGANLFRARLQDANLFRARLQGVNLYNAKLQSANLTEAKLQGTYLYNAELQGADLADSDLTHSNISHARFDPMIDQELKSLRDEMSESIYGTKRLKKVKKTLSERTQKPTTLAKATGEHVWSNKPYGDVVHTTLYGFGNQLKGANNKSEHQSKLSAYLIELSCQDQWVATGIINNRIRDNSFGRNLSQCLMSLKDQKNQSNQLVCPALSEIDEDTITRLKEIAPRNDPNNLTQLPFKCQTELSNPPPESEHP